MEKVGTTNVASNGASLYARIPAPICSILDIKKGTKLNIYKEGSLVMFGKENEINRKAP